MNTTIRRMRKQIRRLTFYSVTSSILFMAILAMGFSDKTTNLADQVLKVKGLIVVDKNGIERVVIGSDFPGPIMMGKRTSRGGEGSIAGIMLHDSEGNERGGYMTSDFYPNIFLTFDDLTSQKIMILSEPFGGATMSVKGENGKNYFLSGGDDSSRLDFKTIGKK